MTNKKYTIGDTVILKEDLKINHSYDGLIYFEETHYELNTVPHLTIVDLLNRGYIVEGFDWRINDEMIETLIIEGKYK